MTEITDIIEKLAALPPWAVMWLLAGGIYAACKLATGAGAWPVAGDRLAYLVLWPGMDARPFRQPQRRAAAPPAGQWFLAAVKILLGAALLWLVARRAPAGRPLLIGWIGMVGLIFLCHFGLFHFLALYWQSRGVEVRPLMRHPLAATSLSDFWSRRWNAGFHELAHRWIFAPLAHPLGAAGALLVAFIASGVVHDLVISLPARGGYGRPTLYFTLQGLGILIERLPAARRCGLGHGIVGWLFTLLFTAAPLGLLFHPAFVLRVIVPFMRAIRAI
jgi:hypothetical protein